MSSIYEFIDGEKANYPTNKMCVWSGVSRSGFYEWRGRPESATAQRRAGLTVRIREIFDRFRQVYGYRRVHHQLTVVEGGTASAELVRSIMVAEELVACQPRPWRQTTVADGTTGPTDRLGGDFSALMPGERLVGDITYIATWQGWWYLATVIDLATREVIGWSMANHMRTSLVIDALDMAWRNGHISPGAIFHSDRGCQYTSYEFAGWLAAHDMYGSMGRTGICWDNAAAESFFATLKKEFVYRTVFPTHRHAQDGIAEYIEIFYNRQRSHSTIDYHTPQQHRQYLLNTHQAA